MLTLSLLRLDKFNYFTNFSIWEHMIKNGVIDIV